MFSFEYRTGMTKKELKDDEVIDLAFRQLVCPKPAIDCNTILADPVKENYRTIDGSCNNAQHPTWGMAFTAQERFIPSGGSLPVTAYGKMLCLLIICSVCYH
jgi:hypothetical protein